MYKFCPACGKKNGGWRFCPDCGFDLSALSDGGINQSQSNDINLKELAAIAQSEADKKKAQQEAFQIENGVLVKYKGDMDEVTIPDSVSVIGDGAFKLCKTIKSVRMPDSVTEIREDAFRSCVNITEVVLSKNLQKIGKGAFYRCQSLRTIDFPLSLYEIGSEAFGSCGLTSLIFPRNLSQFIYDGFGGSTFAYNDDLTKVVFSGEKIELGYAIFDNCSKLSEVSGLGKNSVVGYRSFHECTALEKIDLPYGVTLQDEAFAGSGIKEIVIPDNATFGKYVFMGCTELKKVVISGVIKYKDSYCNEIKLPHSAFSGCVNLQNVEIKPGIEIIDYCVFDNCKSLETLKLPNTLKKILCNFGDCASLKQLEIPDSVAEVCDNLLCGDYYGHTSQCGIKDITIGRGVKNLKFLQEYRGNSQLERITLLGGEQLNVTGEEPYVFCNHKSLKHVSLSNTLKKIDSRFGSCESLEELIIPDSVYEICDFAFSGCPKLRNIKLSSNLCKLGKCAFYDCISLESITLPKKLFSQLHSLNYRDIIHVMGESPFVGCVNLKAIYVPEEFAYTDVNYFDAPDEATRSRIANNGNLARTLEVDEHIFKKYQ